MRSIAFTLLLTLVAAAALGLAGYQWKQGNFDRIFGSPPVAVGSVLYSHFQPEEVQRIEVRSGNLEGVFEREGQHWQALTPWQDRMDPVAAAAIIQFSLGLRVEDHNPKDKIDLTETGLDEKAFHLRLLGDDGDVLAHYKMGRVSSWKAEIEGQESLSNTVFVQPKDISNDKHIYLCAGDITPLFVEDLKLLRDHRPLYFNPLNLNFIGIHSQQGDITLGHKLPQDPWRIVKPLDLPTDRISMQTLIEGLFNLRASQVSGRSEITLPSSASTNSTRIELTRFGQEEPTILEIYPPESLEDTTLKAVVSDRPDTVFILPAKPTPGLISLADLPLDVNALRDATLTHLNIAALKSILISPSTGTDILITRNPGQPWMANIQERTSLANEENLYRLLKAVTSTQVNGFVSDAASDFSPWGLDRPILKLRFLATNNEALELRFGMNARSEFFVNRTGTRTVMKVDGALIRAIAVRPHEWKHSLLWAISRVDLAQLVIKKPDQEPLILRYDDLKAEDQWKAELKGKDVTPRLVPAHANFMLTQLEGIKVSRWLARDDVDAMTALAMPSMSFTLEEQIKDIDDEVVERRIQTLILAPATQPKHHGFYYGKLLAGEHPFLITNELYEKLAADLLED